MKILVVLANFGHANDRHLARVVDEYRSMEYSVDIVVTSDIPRELGSEVQVVVGLPENNPMALPFAHKKLFAERADQYDLFIYSEDDILISKQNIDAFLSVTKVLPEHKIAGFVRSEIDSAGNRYYDPPLACFHWDPLSVVKIAEYTFGFFTNQHSGCFMLTQAQLKRAIASGGFVVGPHEGKYELREAAATDPYTQCGFEELVCVSHLDWFTVQHLPANKHGVRPYRASAEFHRQINALLTLEEKRRPKSLLFQPETKVLHVKWSKDYYEPVREELVSLLPERVRTVLSIGCGWGATEGQMVKKGVRVVGIPMDSVIAACAEARGVEILYGDVNQAKKKLGNETFDCILLSSVLHLVEDPVALLSSCAELLAPGGIVLATVPNFSQVTTRWRRVRKSAHYKHLGDYGKTGIHVTTPRVIRKWFRRSAFTATRFAFVIPKRGLVLNRLSLGLASGLLGEEIICLAERKQLLQNRT
jgi:2-polyprenyl-3-methyl-5-hydroxy-6-metoxy-1,4-benzoquinol methylase